MSCKILYNHTYRTNNRNLEVKPQEFIYTDEIAGIAVFRHDFIATIKTETGEFKKC